MVLIKTRVYSNTNIVAVNQLRKEERMRGIPQRNMLSKSKEKSFTIIFYIRI